MADILPLVPAEEAGLSDAGLDAVDAAVQEQIDNGTLAGAVTLAARNGKIARIHAMGQRDMEAGAPMQADTIFRIFSMTKPITATAMMILADEGLWHPGDPIAKHLPEFAEVKVLTGLDAAGQPIVEDAARAPTMGDLMTHMAGFGYGLAISADPNDPVDNLYRAAKIWEADDLADFSRRVAAQPLAYQPGTRWRYSLSMDLQGAVIERLSGQTLGAFFQERIFGPLGMVDTGFFVPEEKRDRLAALYFKAPDGPLTRFANPLGGDDFTAPKLEKGGGGLFSTALDYARYAQMLVNGGELGGVRIVSERGIAEQMTNRMSDAMMTSTPTAGHQKFRPGFGYGYNGVVFTDPDLAGIPVGKGTYHWDGAAGTWFWADPVNKLVFVGLVQMLSWKQPPLQATTQTLMAGAILR